MEVKDIIELMRAVSDNGLTAFEIEQGDTKITMKREKKIVTVGSAFAAGNMPASDLTGVPGNLQGTAAVPQTWHEESKNSEVFPDKVISCPLVGTFYSSPSPDAEDFVKVGDRVKKGQVIGIVEAMKLMNEIESEYDGVIEAILVKNEETVEYGQPLFRIQ